MFHYLNGLFKMKRNLQHDNAETHSKGEQVKTPLLPNNVDKKSVNDSEPIVGSRQ